MSQLKPSLKASFIGQGNTKNMGVEIIRKFGEQSQFRRNSSGELSNYLFGGLSTVIWVIVRYLFTPRALLKSSFKRICLDYTPKGGNYLTFSGLVG